VQVLESLYEMGPEAAARLLPLIAAESDMANGHEQQQQQQQPSVSSQAGAESMRMRSRPNATTSPVSALAQPLKWNMQARSYAGRAASVGHAGVPRVRQVYGGGFGKNFSKNSARSNGQVVQ
jgi:hypothetical protein